VVDDEKTLPKTLIPFIWHFLRPYKIAVVIYMLLAVAAGFWGPFNSILIKKLINLLPQAAGGNISIITLPASLIVLNFIIFDNFTWRGINYIRGKFIPKIINNIIGESMNYVLGKSHQFYQDNLSGKISKQITNLADGIEKLSSVASNFLRGASLLLTAIIAAYFVNPIFGFILMVWFVLFASASIVMSKKLVSLSDEQASSESIVMGELVDSLSNHSNVRIFSRKSYENSRMAPFFDKQQKAYTATYFYSLILHSIQGGLIAVMMAFSIFFLVHFYGIGSVTIGDFALILGLSMETGHMMWYTMSEVDEFNKAVGRCRQSLESLMLPLEIRDKPGAVALMCPHGKVIFDNIKFNYKGTEPLFQNKTVEIKAAEKVGLVGYSGSGKSTFVNLILRLYDITDGTILIDGQDIRNVTQESLRENIAMIPQDPSLFYRSIMENIRYGKIDATDEEVIEAAKKAHAHEFIEKLPQSYGSLVGERGVKLSGGQRQRIAIARAILKNAPILILDEATSQLDSVTESLIQQSLWELMQNKTTIVIAHRLSTLLHMDRILVFDNGKIVEDGTHNELLSKNRLYKGFWDAQVGGFISDEKHEDRV
jgi:ATP-binding cassette, subfamily B, bacterial